MNIKHDKIDRIVGANLRAARVARDLTQEEVAAALGLTFQQIQKYEKGSNTIASSRIPDICRALKIAPDDLFAGALGPRLTAPPPGIGSWATRLAHDINQLRPAGRRAVQQLVEAMK